MGIVHAADVNDDGIADILTGNGRLFLANGNGTFRLGNDLPANGYTTTGDLNGDGVKDLVLSSGAGTIFSAIANVTSRADIKQLAFSTQLKAREALATLRTQLTRINGELGSIGAYSSRLEVATANLRVGRENFIAASAQIQDADYAHETARLLSTRILQQSAASILAQANRTPELALVLLGT